IGHVRRQSRLKAQQLPGQRVPKGQPMSVKRLPGKVNGTEIVGPVDVATLADERVTAQPRLQSNLVPLAGTEPHFDERCRGKTLDDAILADGVFSARVAR